MADAIGKTADKIGVGVEALQELRFAAKASGVEQQTLDMALQRFTRRAAEAAQGTGEAKDALAQMGIALRDQSGDLRSSEDLLADVADAFARIEDPADWQGQNVSTRPRGVVAGISEFGFCEAWFAGAPSIVLGKPTATVSILHVRLELPFTVSPFTGFPATVKPTSDHARRQRRSAGPR